jgi:hypothetical protein
VALPSLSAKYAYPVEAASYLYKAGTLTRIGSSHKLYVLPFLGGILYPWVMAASQYWLPEPAPYLYVVSSGNYPHIVGTTIQKKPMSQAIGAIGEGLVHPIIQLNWGTLYSKFIEPIFLKDPRVLAAGIIASQIVAASSPPNFKLQPLMPNLAKTPDFILTNGRMTAYVEAKAIVSFAKGKRKDSIRAKVTKGSEQIAVRELASKSTSGFGIVVVSSHTRPNQFVHVGVVALG